MEASSGDSGPLRGTSSTQLELVTSELRKRVGQTFTLAELAQSLRRRRADGPHAALAERDDVPTGGPQRSRPSLGAAFQAYARGASDYARGEPHAARRWPRWSLLGVVVLAVVFLLGVGLGLTLEERPQEPGTITSVRTFTPTRRDGAEIR